MGSSGAAARRSRGQVEERPGGSLRVRVYAGLDPITGRRHYLEETVPPGPTARRDAERARTRLVAAVDDQRSPRTRATVNELLDRYLEVLDVDATTRKRYEQIIRDDIRPVLGHLPIGKVTGDLLDRLYAQLRTCRSRCGARRHDDCRGLSPSSVRATHWIISGAFARALKWEWIGRNPAEAATPPPPPKPNPKPPTPAEAARLLEEAAKDPDWAAFVWTAMTTGARRAELCGVLVREVDLDAATLWLTSGLTLDDGQLVRKDTKTHQQRRVALDRDTVTVLGELLERRASTAARLGLTLNSDGYLFSLAPDGSEPLKPDTATQRYDRMADRLGLDTTLHKLRHYSATELILGGVDVRTVAGRLGHSGGGTTTLRTYAAWVSEADQRAVVTLSTRLPARPRPAV